MTATWFNATDRQSYYSQIDKEIASHLEAVHSLRGRRNTLAPICCLHPEILAEIFSYLVPSVRVFEGRRRRRGDVFDITHVCRHWYNVVLAFPSLWSTIKIHYHYRSSSIQIARLMLQRSKGALLTIEAHSMSLSDEYLAFIQELLQHLPRTRQLSLTCPIDERFPFVPHLSSSPYLEQFHLCAEGSLPMALPRNLLSDAPKLRSLTFRRCSPPWDSSVFRGLTQLKLESLYELSPSREDLWSTLQGSPSLEVLSLDGVLSRLESASLSWDPNVIVDLPKLHHVTLKNTTFPQYAHLFSHIGVPRDAHIDLDVSVSSTEQGLPNSLSLLPSTFFPSQHSETSPRFTCGMYQDLDFVRCIVHRTPLGPGECVKIHPEDDSSPGCGIHLRAVFRCEERQGRLNLDTVSFFPYDPPAFASVDTLCADFSRVDSLEVHWKDLWRTFSQIRDLTVFVDKPRPFLRTLTPEGGHAWAPLLKHLDISTLGHYKDFKGIADVIEQRAQAGGELTTLELEGIELSNSEMVRLRRIGISVSTED